MAPAAPSRSIRFDEYIKKTAEYLAEGDTIGFEFAMPVGGPPPEAFEDHFAASLAAALPAIQRFLARADRARVCHASALRPDNPTRKILPHTGLEESHWREEYLTGSSRTAHELRLGATGLAADEAFWRWLIRMNAQPVLVAPYDGNWLGDWLRNARDPHALRKTGLSASALRYAKRETAAGGRIALVLSTVSGRVAADMLVRRDEAAAVFAAAVENAELSDEFISSNGTPFVRPFDTLGVELWIDIGRPGADSARLIGSALSAVLAGDYTPAAVRRALVAAELVAVVRGTPPAVLAENRAMTGPRIRDEVLAWARAAAALASRDDLQAAAREVVRRVLMRPGVAATLWRSEYWRVAWREITTDLAHRLRPLSAVEPE